MTSIATKKKNPGAHALAGMRGFFFTYGGVTLRFDPDHGVFASDTPKQHRRKALELGMTDCWSVGELPPGWTQHVHHVKHRSDGTNAIQGQGFSQIYRSIYGDVL